MLERHSGSEPKEGAAYLVLVMIALPGETLRARYCTGTVIGWPLSAIKQPRIRAGSVVLAFLM
jgi:hypothetical protein